MNTHETAVGAPRSHPRRWMGVFARGARPGAAGRVAALALIAVLIGQAAPRAFAAPASVSQESSDALHRAEQLLEWGRWKEARQMLAAALSREANNPELLAYQAHVLVGFGADEEALKLAKQSVSLDANCALCHLFLSEALGEKAKHMGKMRALLALHKIRKQLELATQLGPNLPDVHWGWINYNLEVPAAAGGSTAQAMRQAEAIAPQDPVDSRIARASVYLALGQQEQAMQQYRLAAQEHPEDPRGVFYVGLTLFQRDDFAGAEPWLKKALTLQPESSLYAGYYAANLVRLGEPTRAREVLAASAPRHPDSRLSDFLVAKALKTIGENFAWARQLLDSYLATAPEPDQPTHQDARALLASLG